MQRCVSPTNLRGQHSRLALVKQVATHAQRCSARQASRLTSCTAENLKEIKLIATDVDGTLLNSKQELSDVNRRAIQAAGEQGTPVVVATGKPRGPWAKTILPQLGAPVPGVFTNGLVICDGDGETIWSRNLEREIALEGLKLAHELGLTFTAYCGNRILSEVKDEHTDRLIWYGEPEPEPTANLADILGVDIPLQKFILLATDERIVQVRPQIDEHFKGRAATTSALPGMIEVLPLGASKGDGLRRLLDHMGVDPANVMALGDGENDVEMFQLVGFSCAMGNAVPQARQAASTIVAHHDENGLAEGIERFVLEPLRTVAR